MAETVNDRFESLTELSFHLRWEELPFVLTPDEVIECQEDIDNRWFCKEILGLSEESPSLTSQVLRHASLYEIAEHLPNLPTRLQLFLAPSWVDFITRVDISSNPEEGARAFDFLTESIKFGLASNLLKMEIVPSVVRVAELLRTKCEDGMSFPWSWWGNILLLSGMGRTE